MKPLAYIFKRRGINIAAFARLIDTPAASLYSYTSGRADVHQMGVDLFLAIAAGLGVSAADLMAEIREYEEAGCGDGPTARQD